MRNFIVLCLLACLASCTDKKEFQTIRERIDLSGNWNSSLGNCTLPGTTDENKLGDGRHPTNVTSQLTRTYPYSGIVERWDISMHLTAIACRPWHPAATI